jgi:WD40 repeat protein
MIPRLASLHDLCVFDAILMNLSKHWAATLDDYAIDLAWSPDGAILAAASAAGGVMLYDATNGAVRHTLAGHENGTNALAWMPVGRVTPNAPASTSDLEAERRIKDNPPYLLATGGQDGCVRFWDATTGQQTAEVKLGNAWVEHLAWQVGRVIPNAPSSTTDTEAERRIKDNPPYLFATTVPLPTLFLTHQKRSPHSHGDPMVRCARPPTSGAFAVGTPAPSPSKKNFPTATRSMH